MFPEERQKKIIGILDEQKSVRVAELSKMLETSEVTIRRDLEELDKQNKLIRIHGGAMSAYSVGKAISAPELISNAKCIEEKRAISKLAYEYIDDYDTILMDSSSTVYELVKLIAAGTKRNLIIVTTSPLAVTALKDKGDNCKVIMLGGKFNYTHNTVEGYMAACLIKDMRADKCFFGINGIDESFGYSTPRPVDAEMKTLMAASSVHSFMLADSTKFGKSYFAKVNVEVDYIITDARLERVSYSWLEGKTTLLFAE